MLRRCIVAALLRVCWRCCFSFVRLDWAGFFLVKRWWHTTDLEFNCVLCLREVVWRKSNARKAWDSIEFSCWYVCIPNSCKSKCSVICIRRTMDGRFLRIGRVQSSTGNEICKKSNIFGAHRLWAGNHHLTFYWNSQFLFEIGSC